MGLPAPTGSMNASGQPEHVEMVPKIEVMEVVPEEAIPSKMSSTAIAVVGRPTNLGGSVRSMTPASHIPSKSSSGRIIVSDSGRSYMASHTPSRDRSWKSSLNFTSRTPSRQSGRAVTVQSASTDRRSTVTRTHWREKAMSNLQVEDASLMRGMPWSKLLANFGAVLSDNSSNPQYYEDSVPVERIGTFVSHTWRTARWKKFLVLVLHFNLFPALLLSTVVASITCALTALGLLPAVEMYNVFTGTKYVRGLLAWPFGLAAFFLCLFGLHELERFIPLTRHKVFLDKSCVHQSDLELKKKGIQSLAAFLNNSDQMLVMYSAAYMKRLWTCYEVATWLIVKGQKVIARPLFATQLFLIAFAATALFEVVHLATSIVAAGPVPLFIMAPLYIAMVFPIWTAVVWLGAKWADNRDLLVSQVENFKLAEAKCFSEADRKVVRGNIIAFMKFAELVEENAGDRETCEAFEELVHKEVPRLMWSSMGRLGVPYLWSLVWGLPRLLVGLDAAAGDISAGLSPHAVILWYVFNVATVTGALPCICALVFPVMRLKRLRNWAGYIGVGFLASLLIICFQMVFTLITDFAINSMTWLAVLLSLYAVVALVTCLVYRPRCSCGASRLKPSSQASSGV